MKFSLSNTPGVGIPLGIGLGVAVTIGLAFLAWLAPNIVVRLDNTALDIQFRLRGERSPGQEVLLVLVDEKSLKEIGRWPWPRDTQARLIDHIHEGEPAVVGLDIIYAEPEESSTVREIKTWLSAKPQKAPLPDNVLGLLEARLQALDTDRQFAQSIARAGTAVLAMPFLVPEGQTAGPLSDATHVTPEHLRRSEFMLVKQTKSAEESHPYDATAMLPPLDLFVQQARSLGHVYRLPDHDGVTRREVLALRYEDAYYPSFSLEVARLYLGQTREHMALLLGEGVQLGSTVVPTDQKLRMLINYAGRELRFPWVSATDVIHHRVPSDLFRGKAVLVGTAALGTYDQLSTPFSANFPGVEKNATVIENILHQQFLTAGLWIGPVEFGLVMFFGLALTFTLPRVRIVPGTVLTAVTWIGYATAVQALFVVKGVCLPVVMPTVTIGSVFMVTTVLNYVLKERQAREIHSMFSNYVSPRIVQELLKSPSKATLGGQRKELTMLFADLVGFTTFSEHRPAEEVVGQLNEYLHAMTDVIFRWNGTLDKFVGDEIVVFWGAPLDQPDHAELALQCALEMRARLMELQIQWKTSGKPILDNGIGINTGLALVGNIGAEGKKMDYTMIGDQVNLAARFQGLTRTLGHPILLTEFTATKLALDADRGTPDPKRRWIDQIQLRKLQVVTVKGRQKPVAAYTVECQGENAGHAEPEARIG
ncbi:MAG TPA: adenylate/guanylate cyclase domain-containing protein [Nitrospiraceae bacterium]|nr:adenylate/guanylate cyclase domain-containing protein [Nitrospiraceae bacterium]